jgi:hypothetical protein
MIMSYALVAAQPVHLAKTRHKRRNIVQLSKLVRQFYVPSIVQASLAKHQHSVLPHQPKMSYRNSSAHFC